MKIIVLKNFGLNGQNLDAGSVLVVNKSHFGDNEQTFRDEGYFEDFVEPPKEETPTPDADGAKKPAPKAVDPPEEAQRGPSTP